MNFKNTCTSSFPWQWKLNLTIKSTRTKECRVKNVDSICRRDDLDGKSIHSSRPNVLTCLNPFITAEAIELIEELKHRALHFPVATLIGVEPLSAYCIKLVNENDGWCFLLCELERVTDELSPITNEHLNQ